MGVVRNHAFWKCVIVLGAALTKWNISYNKYDSFSRFHLWTQKRSKMKISIGIRDGTSSAILDTYSDLNWKRGCDALVWTSSLFFCFSSVSVFLSVFMRCFKWTIGENSTLILIFKFCLINTVSLFPEGVLLHKKQFISFLCLLQNVSLFCLVIHDILTSKNGGQNCYIVCRISNF